ncbi:hypothetical protein KP509_29G079500 [Ceratopteris richardii]|uniref:Uncharacterized protein n=1 Tax=Ceratopteris richardii TaxID=49495 RepID=A0A8T2RAY2_CERRI|nr:hypothetical protein KP509_29G079500 [Ceratopteris richardii]
MVKRLYTGIITPYADVKVVPLRHMIMEAASRGDCHSNLKKISSTLQRKQTNAKRGTRKRSRQTQREGEVHKKDNLQQERLFAKALVS